jgi:3-deoxy-D-arabino-heptulosonate 7-phosphate (DAHP) synthase class II
MEWDGAENTQGDIITGMETDAELRQMIIRFTQKYAGCTSRQKCMIRSLSGLTFATLQNLVQGFNRDFCLQILSTGCGCHKQTALRKATSAKLAD